MFVDKLKELRKLNNHTQELLAEKLFVSRSLVAKWEQGRAYPSINELEKITEIIKIIFLMYIIILFMMEITLRLDHTQQMRIN